MALFSCYVDIERFLGEPVKELVHFLVCLEEEERSSTIVQIARFFQHVDHIGQFYRFREEKKEQFLKSLSISDVKKYRLWNLIENFFLRHAENSSGKPIPQDDVVSLRKGRLFEEIVYHLGPLEKGRVDLLSMHCQPMINRNRLRISCSGRELSGKNVDVAFWGRHYVEAYECKGNVEFFLKLASHGGERARKVREKVLYLNQLAFELRKYFKTKIYLASFAPDINLEWCRKTATKWVENCGSPKLNFEIITVEDFLRKLSHD